MVGLLIVSHSSRLAAGVRELAQQMAPEARIAVAGGLPDGGIGTSLELILEGLAHAESGDGVVVLMDLGSAVMTAEMAVEMLDEEQRARVRLANAPLAEGALTAAAAAGSGGDLLAVLRAAEEAGRIRKVGEPDGGEGAGSDGDGAFEERELRVLNPAGLHARPAAQIVQLAGRFGADVRLRRLDRPGDGVSAQSLVGLLGLVARQGTTVVASAAGVEAQAALDALAALFADGFAEMNAPAGSVEPVAAVPAQPAGLSGGEIRGVPVSPGMVVGPAFLLEKTEPAAPEAPVTDRTGELARLEAALAGAARELRELERRAATGGGQGEAGIFAAQRLLLTDPELRDHARARIEGDGDNAARAWQQVTRLQAEALRRIDDPLIAGRAADVLDVGRRVVRRLVDVHEGVVAPAGAVVVAGEITPSEVVALDRAEVAGILASTGGPTSHAAILARALGIPAVFGLGPLPPEIAPGILLALDGERGTVVVAPPAGVVESYRAVTEAARLAQQEQRATAQLPAQTLDGRRIVVAANAASVDEALMAVANGAEGIGLLRTEFLYLERPDLPSEDEQVAVLRAIFSAMDGRPVIVRTLDVGGDKSAPALALDPVVNSFLGVRGLRYSLQHPDLFRQQLRALVRAAEGHRVSVMFPMVATIEEVRAARTHLAAIEQALDAEGIARGRLEEVGIMIEVPAAAMIADLLAPEVDFFSVGSNDLVQYVMAAERTNAAVAGLYQPRHPAIARLLARIVEGAHAQGRWVGICGEMAGDPLLTPVFVGLGVDELSMAPASVPSVKAAVRTLTNEVARAAAEGAQVGDVTSSET